MFPKNTEGLDAILSFLAKLISIGVQKSCSALKSQFPSVEALLLSPSKISEFTFPNWYSKHASFLLDDNGNWCSLDGHTCFANGDQMAVLTEDCSLLIRLFKKITVHFSNDNNNNIVFSQSLAYHLSSILYATVDNQFYSPLSVFTQSVIREQSISRQCMELLEAALPGSISYYEFRKAMQSVLSQLDQTGVHCRYSADMIGVFDNCGLYSMGTSETTHDPLASANPVWTNTAAISLIEDDPNSEVLQTKVIYSPSEWRNIRDCSSEIVVFGNPFIPAVKYNDSLSHDQLYRDHFDSFSNDMLDLYNSLPIKADLLTWGLPDDISCRKSAKKRCVTCDVLYYDGRKKRCDTCRGHLEELEDCKDTNTAFRKKRPRKQRKPTYALLVKSFDGEVSTSECPVDQTDEYRTVLDQSFAAKKTSSVEKEHNFLIDNSIGNTTAKCSSTTATGGAEKPSEAFGYKAVYEYLLPLMVNPNSVESINKVLT